MRRIASLFAAFFLCGLLAISGIARADSTISDQGAAELKKQIQDSLQWRIDMAKAAGQGLLMGGDIEVTPKGTFYEVKLPNLSTLMGTQGKLDIGTVTMKATPGAKPGEWLTDATVPETMTFYDAANAPLAHVTIGQQHFSGTWLPATEMYPKFDTLYQKIQIKGVDKKAPTVLIDSVKGAVDMKDNGDGTWSGPLDFEANGIKMDIPANSATLPDSTPMQLAVAKITSRNTYERLDMRQALEIKKAFKEAFKVNPNPTEKEIQALIKSMMPKMPMTPGDVSMAFEVNNFSLREIRAAETQTTDPQAPPPPPPKELVFDKITLSGSSTGAQQEKAVVSMKTNLSGLRVTSVPANLAGLVPHTINAEASLNNLPLKKIAEILYRAIQASIGAEQAPESPEADKKEEKTAEQIAAEAAVANATAALPKILQDARSSLTVDNTFIKSAELDLLLAGKIEADAAAVPGAVGKMTLSIRGMDETIQKLQAEAKKGADPSMMSYAGGLTVVQMIGQASVAADGKSLRSYIFEMSPDGKVLLNGADINLIASGFAGSMGKGAVPDLPPTPEQVSPPAPTPAP